MALPIDARNLKKRYFKPYSPYNESTQSNNTHFWRFRPTPSPYTTCSYKIVFYTGSIKDSKGRDVSVNQFFESSEINGKCNVTDYKVYGKTKNEIARSAVEVFDEYTNLNFGITFTPVTRVVDGTTLYYHETDIADWLYDYNSKDSDGNYVYNQHSYVIYAHHSSEARFTGGALITWMPLSTMKIQGLLKYTGKKIEEWGGLRHEIGHVLGMAHNSDAHGKKIIYLSYNDDGFESNPKYTQSFACVFGNQQLGGYYSAEGKGFISKAKNGNTVESWVCMLDSVYNNESQSPLYTRIYGDVSGNYPNINTTPIFGFYKKHPYSNTPFISNSCRAYLVDNYKKEIMYEVPIDKTGHFCFTLRVLPPLNTAPFYILLTSAEFHDQFLFYIEDAKNIGKFLNPSNSFVYQKDNNEAQKLLMCIKSHKSSDKNKPFSGENWYYHWMVMSGYKGSIEGVKNWNKDKDYAQNKLTNVPLYGYIWYNIVGPLNSSNITLSSNNYINTKISDGTVLGSLKIGGDNGEKRVKTLKELEDITGYKIIHSLYEIQQTKEKSEELLKINKEISDDFSWEKLDDVSY